MKPQIVFTKSEFRYCSEFPGPLRYDYEETEYQEELAKALEKGIRFEDQEAVYRLVQGDNYKYGLSPNEGDHWDCPNIVGIKGECTNGCKLNCLRGNKNTCGFYREIAIFTDTKRKEKWNPGYSNTPELTKAELQEEVESQEKLLDDLLSELIDAIFDYSHSGDNKSFDEAMGEALTKFHLTRKKQ